MTRDEVIAKWNSMQPRERDAWVAEDVMGLELVEHMLAAYPKYRLPDYPDYFRDVPNYSTDISAAWVVLEKPEIMDRIQIGLYPTSFGKWIARPYMAGYENCRVQADSGPEAICLAALIATQGEGIEK
ncbi:BC1872 family protein [Paenibacillus polymyxa]|uniref:Phage ABA sandwich domain-containing protein n=1 Tax=Paenibacillus polymyxa TaxID=1406 RepID=A0ABX2ZG30_PAEPO|nr:hypothetical protein [Paenibacillus polymyxa]ODA10530.1 hypothetical protein A7312_23545 [Paenibacillus polymyxa]